MFDTMDILVIGAGPSGIVSARKLAEAGKKVVIIDRKNHIAGHCYDEFSDDGINIHKYGPHIFHTDYQDVWDFLSSFTDWFSYQHSVIGSIEDKLVPIPVNFNTIEALLPDHLNNTIIEKLTALYGYGNRVPILELRNSKDKEIRFLAEFIYEKVFLNYTAKQWGKRPESIDPSVTARVPIVLSRDNRYFHDKFQGIPSKGYTALFSRMLAHKNIQYILNTNRKDVFSIEDNKIIIDDKEFLGEVIYTGMIDELFDFCEAELPYRSTKMVFEEYNLKYYQDNSVVNYPNDFDFTRITEFKYFQKTRTDKRTVICKEYPQEYIRGGNDPYYIVQNEENKNKYEKYKIMAGKIGRLHMLGRLANYRYYDMDDVIKEAFVLSKGIVSRDGTL
jgi:UDP-galactopyranose mutase